MEAVKNLLNDQQIRAKGMFRFVLEIGFLRWGIPVLILQMILCVFTDSDSLLTGLANL